ncbi:MAG: tRNA epoxyqueuosine(34) reductase QueG [Verrucomicrobia bacterium]|nr:tRNA epoxyqueuosine(34) reductase QueG [Verrucomicrobiota bacterium]
MKDRIQQRARDLGFDACRITTASPPESHPRFQQWLADQRHGHMTYLQRNSSKRLDPDRVLPGAKTIVTLAVSYGDSPPTPGSPRRTALAVDSTPSAPTPPAGPAGVLARYARFTDYHQVLAHPLQALARWIDQLGGPGTRSLWYIDTGPVLERDLAQRAGLGFIGKHTNLIHRHLGNWILLAEILTTLKIEPDSPEKNRCGSCTRCLAACPTAAITAPFQLDARRCISYLTIELKEPIPLELRPAIGNRIFGCDDCLSVCPWNRFAHAGALMKNHARADLAEPDLVELLALDDLGFKRRFAGTPILRAKRRGFLRNVCVALGNVGGAPALPALQRCADDPDPLIAEHAGWAIRRVQARARLTGDS